LILKKLQFGLLAAMLGLAALTAPAVVLAADVWVNTNSGVYHCPGTRYYGNTKRGTYLAESAAVARGYRAANNNPCSPGEASSGRQKLTQDLAPAGTAANNKVWVNVSTGPE